MFPQAPHDFLPAVEEALKKILRKAHHDAHRLNAQTELVALLDDYIFRGGKRLRPLLVLTGYQLISHQVPTEPVIETAAAVELVHAYFLIHDDIMDASDLRRGQPTVHRRLASLYQDQNLSPARVDRLSTGMAILVGDLASALADEALLELKTPSKIKEQLCQQLNQTVRQTIYGQELDLQLEIRTTATAADIETVERIKTAQYSIASPLQLGATLAGAATTDHKLLEDFALPCGIGFQIQDDIIGAAGDEAISGKPVGDDLRQGKQTPISLAAQATLSGQDLQNFTAAFDNPTATREAIDNVIMLLKDRGILEQSYKTMDRYLTQATGVLETFRTKHWDEEAVTELEQIIEKIRTLAHTALK